MPDSPEVTRAKEQATKVIRGVLLLSKKATAQVKVEHIAELDAAEAKEKQFGIEPVIIVAGTIVDGFKRTPWRVAVRARDGHVINQEVSE